MFIDFYVLQVTAFFSLLISVIFFAYNLIDHLRQQLPLQKLLFLCLFSCNIIAMASQILNNFECFYFECSSLLKIFTCYIYMTFHEAALAFISLISFTQFYTLTTTNKYFLTDLQKDQNTLLSVSYFAPLIVSLAPLIHQIYAYSKHNLSQNQACISILMIGNIKNISIIIPTFAILVILYVYEFFSYKWVQNFKYQICFLSEKFCFFFKKEIILTPIIITLMEFPFMVILVIDHFDYNVSLNCFFQIQLSFLNCLGILCAYFYGFNTTLDKLIIWKQQLFIEICSTKNIVNSFKGSKFTRVHNSNQRKLLDRFYINSSFA